MKLLITDLDGTLLDTKDVNYCAYREALKRFGYAIDYSYFCDFCNGRHYTDFLPKVVGNDERLKEIHELKKVYYKTYIDKAQVNHGLTDIIRLLRPEYKTAVVTTASKENCEEILNQFELRDLFDLVLTQEDVTNAKPNPEGFLRAMEYFASTPEETIIFEDSEVGIEAARKSGAAYYKTYKFN